MIVVLPFLTRRNHRYYIVDHGELLPVEFEGGMRGGMIPPAGMMNQQGTAPYPGQQYQPQQYPQQYQQGQQQMYQSPYQKQSIDPYADSIKSPNYSSPPPPPRQQSNYQPGYSGPNAPHQ